MSLICSIDGCGRLAERTGLCATHSREARKEAAPKEKPRRARISKRSDPEREEIYHAIKGYWFIIHGICVVCMRNNSTEVHHMEGRQADLLFDVRKWLPVCRACHERIERNPEWAYENGYSLKRLTSE